MPLLRQLGALHKVRRSQEIPQGRIELVRLQRHLSKLLELIFQSIKRAAGRVLCASTVRIALHASMRTSRKPPPMKLWAAPERKLRLLFQRSQEMMNYIIRHLPALV